MSKMILILGGARSGKSSYAASLVKRINKKTVFIATATALDEEMKKRIRLHKISRPKSWSLIEEPVDLTNTLRKLKSRYGVVLVDCMGLWITNLLMAGIKDRAIEKKIEEFADNIFRVKAAFIIVVSNEVGSGIVPGDPISRKFRDLLGIANQILAKKAYKVIFMQAGIPLIIKGRKVDAKIK
jgi:adenosyl cobinamide kinase/adenosyl cobinamide phosphate guanylyltransferase